MFVRKGYMYYEKVKNVSVLPGIWRRRTWNVFLWLMGYVFYT